jgi:translation elongation factor EF-Tu-like GTPase
VDQDLVGKVVHYYDKIGVAIIRLSKDLKVGDAVKFVKGDKAFEQVVESMQWEHKVLSEGKAGQDVAVKVNQPAKEGTQVYKV